MPPWHGVPYLRFHLNSSIAPELWDRRGLPVTVQSQFLSALLMHWGGQGKVANIRAQTPPRMLDRDVRADETGPSTVVRDRTGF